MTNETEEFIKAVEALGEAKRDGRLAGDRPVIGVTMHLAEGERVDGWRALLSGENAGIDLIDISDAAPFAVRLGRSGPTGSDGISFTLQGIADGEWDALWSKLLGYGNVPEAVTAISGRLAAEMDGLSGRRA